MIPISAQCAQQLTCHPGTVLGIAIRICEQALFQGDNDELGAFESGM